MTNSKAPSQKEIFGVSGPYHLSSNNLDWSIPDHRLSVVASLVRGVYILERDRQKKRLTEDVALAPKWWTTFNFQCLQILVDERDSSTFGAIFEYKPRKPNPPQTRPPKYVIAFRGTLIKFHTGIRDLKLDIKLAFNKLTRDPRYQTSLECVHNLISQAGGSEKVWIAGHSLGAAIALQIGKEMATKERIYIESYLFNPPYLSAPIEILSDPDLKFGIRVAKSFVTGLATVALKCTMGSTSSEVDSVWRVLEPWNPYLFVNENDPISCEYIGYFEHRERMKWLGLGWVERVASKRTLLSLGLGLHLIPTAFVVKNLVGMKNEVKFSHGIQQWWQPHSCWETKQYRFQN